jgi:hypothetical protein
MTAIHQINPFQQMVTMIADPQDARRNLPEALQHVPLLEAVQDRATAATHAAARAAA